MQVEDLVREGDIAGLRSSFSALQMSNQVIPGTYMVRDRTFKNLPLLHFAVLYHKLDVVHFLLTSYVMPDMFCSEGMTPLHLAAFLQMKDIAELLLMHGANLRLCDKYGHSPLLYAISNRDTEMVRSLLMSGAMDETDMTPLHLALATGQLEIVKLLMQYGANPHAKNRVGKTAFELLKMPEGKEFEEVLRRTRIHAPLDLEARVPAVSEPVVTTLKGLMTALAPEREVKDRLLYKVTKL